VTGQAGRASTGWRIYRGDGQPHDGIVDLPAPPPWRAFDGEVLEQSTPDLVSGTTASPATLQRARAYLPDDELVDVVNIAMLLRRPLLVTGKPGTGKSTLAHSIAFELKLGPVLYWPITSRSQMQDALYRYDSIGRLQQANLQRQEGKPVEADIGRFMRLGPFGSALLARERSRVLLIDELDKSDTDFPNDLLNVLEEGQFEIIELSRLATDTAVRVMTADPDGWGHVAHGIVRCKAFPIVIITSNGEREFPPAFLRRCLRHTIQPPDARKLAHIVAAQLGDGALQDAQELVTEFAGLRDHVDLATDQLLNAVYFATSGLQPDPVTRQRLVTKLFHGLGSVAES
jgi:MoxR-like ATPase